jgi:hypothetical protein
VGFGWIIKCIGHLGLITAKNGNTLTDSQLASVNCRRYCRRSVGQSLLMSGIHLGPMTKFYCCETFAALLMWGTPSELRTGLQFATVAGPRQRSYSKVRAPHNSWSHQFFCPRLETPPTWMTRSPYLHLSGTGRFSYTSRDFSIRRKPFGVRYIALPWTGFKSSVSTYLLLLGMYPLQPDHVLGPLPSNCQLF